MIEIYTGLPGAGKSLKTAQVMVEVLERNKKFWKRSGIVRKVVSNLKLAPHLHERYEKFVEYWEDPRELVKLRDVDVFWDEIATHLDATQWKDCPLELKRWLQQHRKFGVDIYGNTQDFKMIDISMRRLTQRVYLLTKLIGSRDKSATRPKVKKYWGLIIERQIDPDSFADDKTDYSFVSSWFFPIRRKYIEAFDTTQEIKAGKYPQLRHIVRECEDEHCSFVKVIHV